MSDKTEAAVRSLQWDLATQLWDETENAVEAASAGVNFYNILDRSGGDDLHKSMRKFRFNAGTCPLVVILPFLPAHAVQGRGSPSTSPSSTSFWLSCPTWAHSAF
jgi:hypothetical protein